MPWLLNPTILLGLALTLALGAVGIQTKRLDSAQTRIQVVTAEFRVFKAQVAEEGRKAQEAARLKAEQDLQTKKNEEIRHAKELKSLDAAYAAYRLRIKSGADASSRIVPAASADPGAGDLICYSRDTLDREITSAIGRLYGELAGDAEPYDKAVAMARTCRDWAMRTGKP